MESTMTVKMRRVSYWAFDKDDVYQFLIKIIWKTFSTKSHLKYQDQNQSTWTSSFSESVDKVWFESLTTWVLPCFVTQSDMKQLKAGYADFVIFVGYVTTRYVTPFDCYANDGNNIWAKS